VVSLRYARSAVLPRAVDASSASSRSRPGDHDLSSAARLPLFGQGVYDLWRARHTEPGRT